MPIDSTIRDLINQYGHISVDLLMKEALTSNSSSYYQQQNLIGAGGDFTTSPEISQLFGEIIGLWVIEKWQQLGDPKKINLLEMGPGRGLLMRDLLRVAKLVPKFYNSLQIQLVEINHNFIEWQQSNLSQFNLKIDWLTKIEDSAELPSIIIANEFFDALPIKQYIKIKEMWYESTFIIDPSDGKIRFDKIGLSKELQAQLLQDHPNAFDGAIVEESLSSLETIRFMLKHIKNFGGNCLIIDYGYDVDPRIRARHQYGSTLQAVKNHKYHPILETLGEADLSAHVDFYALRKTAKEQGFKVNQPISQRDFLMQYGINIRAKLLKNNLLQDQTAIIDKQVERLTSPSQMGELFKVLVV